MTINFNNISIDEVNLFVKYPELFTDFRFNSNTPLDIDLSVESPDAMDNFLEFGAVKNDKSSSPNKDNVIIPANLPFTITKPKNPHAYFNIRRGNNEIEIVDIDNLDLTAELSTLGEKCYKVAKDLSVTMLDAVEQLYYYANVLNVTLKE